MTLTCIARSDWNAGCIFRALDVHTGDCLVWSLDSQGNLVVSGRRQHTLTEIRAAVAAAGLLTAPADITVQDMKAGIAAAMRKKHGRG